MRKLKTDYLDLVLLHQPFADAYGAYRALEEMYDAGKIRAIGISNFYVDIHWGGASGAITSFMNRVFYTDLNGGGNRFWLKPAAAVISARRAGTTATWDQINKYFGLMQMPIVTSRYWNMVHGTTPEEVKQDLEGMQVMQILGKNMAFFINCKNIALKMGLECPTAHCGRG